MASGSCRWRKEAGGVAANWFPSDNPLALQWWDSGSTLIKKKDDYRFFRSI